MKKDIPDALRGLPVFDRSCFFVFDVEIVSFIMISVILSEHSGNGVASCGYDHSDHSRK